MATDNKIEVLSEALEDYLDASDLSTPADAVAVIMEYGALLSQRDIEIEEIVNLLNGCAQAIKEKYGEKPN